MKVPQTPLRCLERAVSLYGARVGIVCGESEFTYAQFAARCGRLASGLRQLGLERGDRAAFLSFNTHKLLEGYYGVVQAGAIVMPLNVRLSQQELSVILNHSGARVVCFERDFAATAEALRAECPAVERWVGLDEATPPADLTYEELLDSGRETLLDSMSVDEDSVAELFYTSGSTGTPKGVMLTHRNLYTHALMIATIMQDSGHTVDLHTIPLFHANGWGRPQASTMLGTKQVMVRRFDPAAVFRLIEKHRATDMSLVPTMANMLLTSPARGEHDLSSLRLVMIGGAASSPELIERMETAFGCQAFAGYGLTETSPVLTIGRLRPEFEALPARERWRRQSMAGWPVAGVELRLTDLAGQDVPRDGRSVGEIAARGDNVMLGYYQEPAATAAVLRDGWFHTGDMAVWDEYGCVQIVDRKKEIIISGGENISSLEVEKAIFSHPAVFECAVVAAPDEKWGEVPAAIVVVKPGETLTAEALVEYLRGLLGHFKTPKVVEITDQPLPKTGTGKIRKMVLRERFWAGREKRVQG
jgi:fatty-acyl-CoA synthase